MSLTIVLERHLLRGSNVKIRLNTPSPGFAFQQRECTTSRREFLLGENYVLAANAIKILLPGRILAGISEKSFSLGGIPASTDFSASTRREFFPERIPPGKQATSAGSRRIPAGSRWAPRILAGSRRDPGTYFTRELNKSTVVSSS